MRSGIRVVEPPARGTPEQAGAPTARPRANVLGVGAALAAYLVLAVLLWWQVWSVDPTTRGVCGCGDPSLFLWFITWPAHAIAHGLDPWYSGAMLAPHGVNLLDNTSVLAVGVPLAPVTWLFGPVATVNVAATAAPALSAGAVFLLLRRWGCAIPAAFLGGLLYGFSPFLVLEAAGSYLMLTLLPVPPLVLWCLDEILVRQRRSAVVGGLGLALLFVVQFFVSTEVLVMMAILAVLGGALLAAGSAVVAPAELRRRLPHAWRALLVAAGAGAVVLAYPVWFALAGPGHLSGPLWLVPTLGYAGNPLHSFWQASYPSAAAWSHLTNFAGGNQGPPPLNPQYLGWGLLAVLGAGWVLWWRDARLWLLGTLGLLAGWLSLGTSPSHWTPWALFARLPELNNVIPGRFSLFVDLCAAAMLGLVVDHAARAVMGAVGGRRGASAPAALGLGPGAVAHRRPPRWPAVVASGAAGLLVAAAALVPIGVAEAGQLPLTAVDIAAPRWFTETAPHLAAHQVALIYPYPSSGVQSPMVWQALGGMTFAMVGGGGPGGAVARTGAERPGAEVLASLSEGLGPEPVADAANRAAVRHALTAWGVTMVVIPDQSGLPPSERGRNPAYARRFLTDVLGRPPARQRGAWVWSDVQGALLH